MCTIGVKRLGDDDYILFKNKDFGRAASNDRISLGPDVFGVVGVSTWDGSDPDLDVFSGISLGANATGLLCCDANVQGASDQSNYDELVEVALRAGEGVDGAIAAVRAAVAQRPYLWGNLIMIDALGAATVEVRDQTVAVTSLSGPAARSNHHLELGAGDDPPGGSTVARLKVAQRRLESAVALADIHELQRSHDQGITGICSHEIHQTVYAYVLRRRGDETALYVTKGHPCEVGRVELIVPLGRRWSDEAATRFRERYPSDQAMVGS
jgi:hypothetical protein